MKLSKNYTVYPIELLNIREESERTYTYNFTKPEELIWDEGAHTHLALNRINEELGWWEKKDVRHFSIMSLPEERFISITTRIPEAHTEFKEFLSHSNIGDTYYLFKVGSRLKLRREDRPIILLTQGVGIASVRPLLKRFDDNSDHITSLYHLNVDRYKPYIFEEEFKKYNENPKIRTVYTSNRNAYYEVLNDWFSSDFTKKAYYYIIGSDAFLIDQRRHLNQMGISDEQIIIDKKEEKIKALF